MTAYTPLTENDVTQLARFGVTRADLTPPKENITMTNQTHPYPEEILGEDDDNGTMPDSRDALRDAVVGRRIVNAEQRDVPSTFYGTERALVLTLDDGREVQLVGEGDCCAYTEVQEFWRNPELVEHVITGVGTTDGFTTWHIYADLGDVMKLTVGWSCGNPFYYGYGFDIRVAGATLDATTPCTAAKEITR